MEEERRREERRGEKEKKQTVGVHGDRGAKVEKKSSGGIVRGAKLGSTILFLCLCG